MLVLITQTDDSATTCGFRQFEWSQAWSRNFGIRRMGSLLGLA
jgi:hypothetical protein